MEATEPDPVWEELRAQGRNISRYPFDVVVSFLFRWSPKAKPRSATKVLEVGCGAGNNLWFAAREGFQVAGIDGSASAISIAKQRFDSENLKGDLRTGNFLKLPWKNKTFHFGIDRCSITCVGRNAQRLAVSEMHRVLLPGGLFFFNCYSSNHTSAKTGKLQKDGRIGNIQRGTLKGVGPIAFNSQSQVKKLFSKKWAILEINHLVIKNQSQNQKEIHAEWRVTAQKK